ncbi:MAG: hypothetical protein IPL20_14385 [Saprospiraceae bacterium]|nr:hypothetical protein [Saprospiraceae bacterium]
MKIDIRKNLITALLITISSVANSQIINFPDANFKNALVNSKCVDLNGDGIGDADADVNNDVEIDNNEALLVSLLTVSNKGISNLTGIEYFKNLVILNCSNNQLINLDLLNFNKLLI